VFLVPEQFAENEPIEEQGRVEFGREEGEAEDSLEDEEGTGGVELCGEGGVVGGCAGGGETSFFRGALRRSAVDRGRAARRAVVAAIVGLSGSDSMRPAMSLEVGNDVDEVTGQSESSWDSVEATAFWIAVASMEISGSAERRLDERGRDARREGNWKALAEDARSAATTVVAIVWLVNFISSCFCCDGCSWKG
ncbi:LOW QUALITY PROTEIN: hypothetical protein HJC23_004649, partial [Cyclotella cryptica]